MKKIVISIFITALAAGCSSKQELTSAVEMEKPRAKVDPKTVPYEELLNWKNSYKTSKQDDSPSIAVEVASRAKSMSNAELLKEANSLLRQGERRKAKAYYHELVRLDPSNTQVLLELASLYLEENQVEESFSTLMEIKNLLNDEIRNDGSFVYKYRYTLAVAHLKRGENNKGHQYLSKLIAEDPSFAPAYATLAGNYVKLDKLSTAEFVAKRGLEKAGDDAALYNLLGVIERTRGTLETAETWFNKALEKDPNHIPSLVNRASVNIIRFEYETASKDVGKALSLNPFDVSALMMGSVILHKQDQLEAAKNILVKAVDIEPENAGARFNLALIEEKLERQTSARQLLEEVLQLEKKGSGLYEKAKLKLVELAPLTQ